MVAASQPSIRDKSLGSSENSSVMEHSSERRSAEQAPRKDEDVSQEEKASEPEVVFDPKISTVRLWIIMICLATGLFVSLMDSSIVATALFTIGHDFSELDTVNWVALAYTLSYLGVCVIFAFIGDVVGRRNAFIAAFVIFVAFSLGCGFAQNMDQLIALRALQGVGGSGLYSLVMVIFPDITPLRMMPFIGSIIGAVVAMAGVLGPVLGGLITHYTTWRWVFWINAPICVLPAIAFYFAWPSADQMRPVAHRTWKQLDFVGCILLVAASVLFVFAFQQAGSAGASWNSGLFIGPLVAGVVSWGLLFGWEAFVERKWPERVAAIFPTRFFRRRVYMAGVVTTTLMGFPYFYMIFALPLRMQVVNQKSALVAGLGLLPMLASSAVGSAVTGAVNGKQNRLAYTLTAGMILLTVGTATMTTLDSGRDIPSSQFGFEVLCGLGFGMSVATASMQTAVESSINDVAVSQGIVAQVRILGGSIAIAASSAILAQRQRSHLINTGLVTAAQLQDLPRYAPKMSPEQLMAIAQTYADSFGDGAKVCAGIGALGVLAAMAAYRKNPLSMMETRKQQAEEEGKRLKALAERMAAAKAEKANA